MWSFFFFFHAPSEKVLTRLNVYWMFASYFRTIFFGHRWSNEACYNMWYPVIFMKKSKCICCKNLYGNKLCLCCVECPLDCLLHSHLIIQNWAMDQNSSEENGTIIWSMRYDRGPVRWRHLCLFQCRKSSHQQVSQIDDRRETVMEMFPLSLCNDLLAQISK